MAWILSVSICEYNPPLVLLCMAVMAILWYMAHCVSCHRNARRIMHQYREKLNLSKNRVHESL